jgi:hypothetical protein
MLHHWLCGCMAMSSTPTYGPVLLCRFSWFAPHLMALTPVQLVFSLQAAPVQPLPPPMQLPPNAVALPQELWDVMEALLSMNAGGVRRVRLVVNTRMALGGGLGGADQIHMAALSPADSQELLLVHAGQEVAWKDGQAMQLVEICGGNALALTLVGGLLSARRCTPKVLSRARPHTLSRVRWALS